MIILTIFFQGFYTHFFPFFKDSYTYPLLILIGYNTYFSPSFIKTIIPIVFFFFKGYHTHLFLSYD